MCGVPHDLMFSCSGMKESGEYGVILVVMSVPLTYALHIKSEVIVRLRLMTNGCAGAQKSPMGQ